MTVADSDGMWQLRLVFLPLVFPSLSFLLQPTTSSLSHSLPPPPFPYPLFFGFFLCFSASPNLSRSSLYLCFFLSAPSSPLLSFGFFSYVSVLRFPVLSSSPSLFCPFFLSSIRRPLLLAYSSLLWNLPSLIFCFSFFSARRSFPFSSFLFPTLSSRPPPLSLFSSTSRSFLPPFSFLFLSFPLFFL